MNVEFRPDSIWYKGNTYHFAIIVKQTHSDILMYPYYCSVNINGNQLNPLIKELEEQEKALINKQFSNEMIKRQKDIMTRLLESEKAMMERGFEEKRESVSGNNVNNGNKIRFDEYNNQKLKQIELLRSVDPMYRKYYKDKANEYFNQSF